MGIKSDVNVSTNIGGTTAVEGQHCRGNILTRFILRLPKTQALVQVPGQVIYMQIQLEGSYNPRVIYCGNKCFSDSNPIAVINGYSSIESGRIGWSRNTVKQVDIKKRSIFEMFSDMISSGFLKIINVMKL